MDYLDPNAEFTIDPSQDLIDKEEEYAQQQLNQEQRIEAAGEQEASQTNEDGSQKKVQLSEEEAQSFDDNPAKVGDPREQSFAWEEGFDGGDLAREMSAAALAPVLGVGDFISDVAGMIGFKGADEWWDKNSLRGNNKFTQVFRDLSSIIIPSLASGAGLIRLGNWATKGVNLARRTKLFGGLAAELAADTGVAAISSHTSNDENIGQALEESLGWQIPWATRDGDTPDVIWRKNMLENTGLGVFSSVLSAAFAGRKVQKVFDKSGKEITPRSATKASAEELDELDKYVTTDEVAEAVERYKADRATAEDLEAISRLEADPMGVKGYDPFINVPSEPNARAVPGAVDVDPQGAAVARGRISNNNGTTNGQQGAVLTPGQKKTYETGTNADRLALVEELDEQVSIPQVVKVDGKSSNIQKSIDDLAEAGLRRAVDDVDKFDEAVESFRLSNKAYDENISVSYLSDTGLAIVSGSNRKLMDEFLRLNELSYRRGSAMITQSAAEDATNAANAVRKMDDAYPVERQMENLFSSLAILTEEERRSRWIAGKSLSMLQDLQSFKPGSKEYAKAYAEALEEVPVALQKIKDESISLTNTLKELSEKNPEFVKPFIKAYDMSNGDINTLMKLQDYASNRIGFLKKALIDTNPQVASQLVQELRALRYNSVLSGLAPIRAAVGNTMMLALKPITTLVGSAVSGGNFERALYTFGGIQENIQRAFKMMGDEWKYVRLNPDAAYARGRVDLDAARLDDIETMDAMAEAWIKDGQKGKALIWKSAMLFHGFNNNGLVRYGIDAMYALDGFVKSMVASGAARATAYDELYESGKKISKEAFDAKQRKVYSQAFDAENMPTDKAVKFAASEMSLNIDNTVAQKVQDILKYIPAAEAVFMFARTGLNGLEMAWSYAPVSGLGGAIGRARKVFNAKTKEQMIEALREHGVEEFSEQAFKAIKSEYIGRQIMGGLVVMGAATYALNGNLTGTGPADKAELRRMRAMGYQPQSIRNPITGEWHSYRGFEPFDSLMGLVGDVVYFANQNDSSFTEDTLRKISASISMNIASKSFISGFEPLVSLFSGDENAWSRFLAMQADSLIPGSGLRGAISRVVNPQLKDVDSDFWQQMANRNKGWPNNLPDQLDVYTGEPIQGWNPLVDSINGLLPFFKTNPGFEPWREWLINTGWDNLQTIRKNPLTEQPLTGEERQWINNWIGTNGNLKEQIEEMSQDPFWLKSQQEYLDSKTSQSDMPIKKSELFLALDRIHNRAFDAAWAAFKADPAHQDSLKQYKLIRQRNTLLNRGNNQGAADVNKQIEELRRMPK